MYRTKCANQALREQTAWDKEEQAVSSPSVKPLLIRSVTVGRKRRSWPRGWGSIMETMTAESPETAEGQREEDDLRPRRGCVGCPKLLWHAPGDTRTHDKSEVVWQMFIPRPDRPLINRLVTHEWWTRPGVIWMRAGNRRDGGDDRVMRGGGQTGDSEMKLRPAGQTLTGKSILHHPFYPPPPHTPSPSLLPHHRLLLSLSDRVHQ